MATFHLFPSLPLELRILVWQHAVEERVLVIRRANWGRPDRSHWSPTPPPAVTRACSESRKYCSYVKAFTTALSPCYVWTNFDCDHVQMRVATLRTVPNESDIRHLHFDRYEGSRVTVAWYRRYCMAATRYYRNLRSVRILVEEGSLTQWTDFLTTTDFGACPAENVRIVDRSTGEWIDSTSCDGYRDWVDSHGGEKIDGYTRVVHVEDEYAERAEARKRLQIPLPRMDLSSVPLDDYYY
jgi:hypothetical protein